MSISHLRAWCVALGLVAALPGGAAAQIPTSSQEIRPTMTEPGLEEIARTDAVLRELVACAIDRMDSRTRGWLATVPGSYQEQAVRSRMQSRLESCYDFFETGLRALSLPNNVLRGVIAETYYHRDVPGGIRPAAGASAEASAGWVAARAADGQVTGTELAHAMARCVTVRRPAEVAALLATNPLSGAARSALRALQGDFSACLDQGVELDASRQSLRALLAEAALHYAQAQRSGFAPMAAPSRD